MLTGGIVVTSGFNLETDKPLDYRTQCATIVARDAIPATVRYQGLNVFVIADGKNYQLVGGILNTNWVEGLGGGSGGGILSVADIVARDAIDAGDRYEGLIVYVIDGLANYQLRGGILNSNWAEIPRLGLPLPAGVPDYSHVVLVGEVPTYLQELHLVGSVGTPLSVADGGAITGLSVNSQENVVFVTPSTAAPITITVPAITRIGGKIKIIQPNSVTDRQFTIARDTNMVINGDFVSGPGSVLELIHVGSGVYYEIGRNI